MSFSLLHADAEERQRVASQSSSPCPSEHVDKQADKSRSQTPVSASGKPPSAKSPAERTRQVETKDTSASTASPVPQQQEQHQQQHQQQSPAQRDSVSDSSSEISIKPLVKGKK